MNRDMMEDTNNTMKFEVGKWYRMAIGVGWIPLKFGDEKQIGDQFVPDQETADRMNAIVNDHVSSPLSPRPNECSDSLPQSSADL